MSALSGLARRLIALAIGFLGSLALLLLILLSLLLALLLLTLSAALWCASRCALCFILVLLICHQWYFLPFSCKPIRKA